MQSKENQRVRLTKRLLRESLLALLAKTELSKISVSALCATAGIHRSTFYQHYGSPYELLEEIAAEFSAQLDAFCQKDSASAAWSLERQVTEICRYLQLHKSEALLLLQNFSAEDAMLRKLLKQRILSHPQCIAEMQQYAPETQALLRTFLTHGIYGLLKEWLSADCRQKPEEIGRLAAQIAQNGWLR